MNQDQTPGYDLKPITKNIMDSKFFQIIQNKLLKEKKRLKEELSQFTRQSIHNKDDYQAQFPDFGDKEDENVAEIAIYGDRLSLERSLEKKLKDVNTALNRMKEGNYGICQYCKKSINEKRLLARPESSSCISCKQTLKRSK